MLWGFLHFFFFLNNEIFLVLRCELFCVVWQSNIPTELHIRVCQAFVVLLNMENVRHSCG